VGDVPRVRVLEVPVPGGNGDAPVSYPDADVCSLKCWSAAVVDQDEAPDFGGVTFPETEVISNNNNNSKSVMRLRVKKGDAILAAVTAQWQTIAEIAAKCAVTTEYARRILNSSTLERTGSGSYADPFRFRVPLPSTTDGTAENISVRRIKS
jgi:hypothetical protein